VKAEAKSTAQRGSGAAQKNGGGLKYYFTLGDGFHNLEFDPQYKESLFKNTNR
jgi:hypothetical protein